MTRAGEVPDGPRAVGSPGGGRGIGTWDRAHVGSAMALQQARQQGKQQRKGQQVQQEAEEDHSDHARLGRRLLADGWARGAAPTGSPAHDGGARFRPAGGVVGLHEGTSGYLSPRCLPYHGENSSQLPSYPIQLSEHPSPNKRVPLCTHPPDSQQEAGCGDCARKPQSPRPTVPRGRGEGIVAPGSTPPHAATPRRPAELAGKQAQQRAGSLRTRRASLRPREHDPSRPRARARLLGGAAGRALDAGVPRPEPRAQLCPEPAAAARSRRTAGWMDGQSDAEGSAWHAAWGRAGANISPRPRPAPGSGCPPRAPFRRSGPGAGSRARPAGLESPAPPRLPGARPPGVGGRSPAGGAAPPPTPGPRGSRLRPARGLAVASGGSRTYFPEGRCAVAGDGAVVSCHPSGGC